VHPAALSGVAARRGIVAASGEASPTHPASASAEPGKARRQRRDISGSHTPPSAACHRSYLARGARPSEDASAAPAFIGETLRRGRRRRRRARRSVAREGRDHLRQHEAERFLIIDATKPRAAGSPGAGKSLIS
jgi:hypothetical protein